MSTGKYSPTVYASYHADQGWWKRHCESEGDWYDRDGYDEYGYDKDERDRAGFNEEDYMADEDGNHHLWEEVNNTWLTRIIA